uniref:Uncharacterized protein n=1 Tax=viral metagenome TaxID=1070528 RepID=A0A2V0RBH9_9ZZZZ
MASQTRNPYRGGRYSRDYHNTVTAMHGVSDAWSTGADDRPTLVVPKDVYQGLASRLSKAPVRVTLSKISCAQPPTLTDWMVAYTNYHGAQRFRDANRELREYLLTKASTQPGSICWRVYRTPANVDRNVVHFYDSVRDTTKQLIPRTVWQYAQSLVDTALLNTNSGKAGQFNILTGTHADAELVELVEQHTASDPIIMGMIVAGVLRPGLGTPPPVRVGQAVLLASGCYVLDCGQQGFAGEGIDASIEERRIANEWFSTRVKAAHRLQADIFRLAAADPLTRWEILSHMADEAVNFPRDRLTDHLGNVQCEARKPREWSIEAAVTYVMEVAGVEAAEWLAVPADGCEATADMWAIHKSSTHRLWTVIKDRSGNKAGGSAACQEYCAMQQTTFRNEVRVVGPSTPRSTPFRKREDGGLDCNGIAITGAVTKPLLGKTQVKECFGGVPAVCLAAALVILESAGHKHDRPIATRCDWEKKVLMLPSEQYSVQGRLRMPDQMPEGNVGWNTVASVLECKELVGDLIRALAYVAGGGVVPVTPRWVQPPAVVERGAISATEAAAKLLHWSRGDYLIDVMVAAAGSTWLLKSEENHLLYSANPNERDITVVRVEEKSAVAQSLIQAGVPVVNVTGSDAGFYRSFAMEEDPQLAGWSSLFSILKPLAQVHHNVPQLAGMPYVRPTTDLRNALTTVALKTKTRTSLGGLEFARGASHVSSLRNNLLCGFGHEVRPRTR